MDVRLSEEKKQEELLKAKGGDLPSIPTSKFLQKRLNQRVSIYLFIII